jgi:hypothetical protein
MTNIDEIRQEGIIVMTATASFSELQWTADHVILPPSNKMYKLFQLRTAINVPDLKKDEDVYRSYAILHDGTGEVLCNVLVSQHDVEAFRKFQSAIIRSRVQVRPSGS